MRDPRPRSNTPHPSSAARRLVARVAACRQCPRMAGVRRVLGHQNGPWNARWMFVGEAPGRLGADRTGIPFCGDRSGARFELLLAAMELDRGEVFITNAVVCNPRGDNGCNAAPNRAELNTCREYLRDTIDVVDPAVVVALGKVALATLGRIAPHDMAPWRSPGRLVAWYERQLAALRHPSPRSAAHRPWSQQLRDARRLRRAVDGIPTSPPSLPAG